MSYGLELYNASGDVMFSTGEKALYYIKQGSGTYSNTDGQAIEVSLGMSTSTYPTAPMILFKFTKGLYTNDVILFEVFKSGSNWAMSILVNGNSIPVTWYAYSTHVTEDEYGLTIYNDDSSIAFTSKGQPLDIVTHKEISLPLTGTVTIPNMPSGTYLISSLPVGYLAVSGGGETQQYVRYFNLNGDNVEVYLMEQVTIPTDTSNRDGWFYGSSTLLIANIPNS